jgi:hypothetical protein
MTEGRFIDLLITVDTYNLEFMRELFTLLKSNNIIPIAPYHSEAEIRCDNNLLHSYFITECIQRDDPILSMISNNDLTYT